ncbi:MAG: hypothetical protein IT347_01685 [Candidatus Eisenbacteria bacterium]|nr:hypothetical protein [Candidatus Eisenbacteria bacterium]
MQPGHARFLFAALLLALALVPPAPAGAQDYPRLGLYWSVHRDGRPLLRADGTLDPDIASQVARYDEIVVDVDPFSPYRPDAIAALRSLNPGIKMLGYVTGHHIWPSADPDSLNHFPTRYWRTVRDLDGFLYNRSGQRFGLSNSALADVNLAKRDANGRFVVAEALASLFHDAVVATGTWDGVFLDAYCDGILWAQSANEMIDFARAGYPSAAAFDAAWKAGSDTLASRLRALSGPTPILVGNCGYGTKYAWFNGWMRENFPNQGGGTWYSNMLNDTGGYLKDDEKFRQPVNNFIFSGAGYPGLPYDPLSQRQVRYGLGSAALGDGYGVYGYIGRVTDVYPYWTWWYDEYAVDLSTGRSSTLGRDTGWLGRPLGRMYQMIWVGTAPDAVSNTDLESDLSGWTSYFATPGGMTRDATTAGKGFASLRVHVAAASSTDWHANVASSGSIAMIQGLTYSATFWAKASNLRNLPVVANEPGVGEIARQYVTVDTNWRQYQVALVPTRNGTGKLQFYLGLEAGDVWLDDLHLQAGSTTLFRRDFDNGTVLVNPGPADLTVPLGPGYRRILGIRDPVTNDGTDAATVTVPSRDARFLVAASADTIPPAPINDAAVRP